MDADTTATNVVHPVLATVIQKFSPNIPFAIVSKNTTSYKTKYINSFECKPKKDGYSSSQWQKQGKILMNDGYLVIPDICKTKCNDTVHYRKFQIFLNGYFYTETGHTIVKLPKFDTIMVRMITYDQNMQELNHFDIMEKLSTSVR